MIVCFGNCLTSVFAGFAIFSVLGFLATELGVEVKAVVNSGTGLAFIAYPDLVTRLPLAPFWAILFFAMLFTLGEWPDYVAAAVPQRVERYTLGPFNFTQGLDSQFAIVETVLTGILDFKPHLRSKKTIIVGIVCLVGFIAGLPLTTEVCPFIKLPSVSVLFRSCLPNNLLFQWTPLIPKSLGLDEIVEFWSRCARGPIEIKKSRW